MAAGKAPVVAPGVKRGPRSELVLAGGAGGARDRLDQRAIVLGKLPPVREIALIARVIPPDGERADGLALVILQPDGDVGAPGWTNGNGPTCSDPYVLSTAVYPNCPDAVFQFHHQPFNYYADLAPGTQAR